MVQLTAQDVRKLAQQAGFSGQGLDYITAIAGRESGYQTGAYNGNVNTNDNSVGLTQVNLYGDLLPGRLQILQSLGYNATTKQDAINLLSDPAINLKVAYVLSNGGTNFSPWKMNSDPNSFLQGTSLASSQGATGTAPGGTANMPSSDDYAKYAALRAQYDPLNAKVQTLNGLMAPADGTAGYDSSRNAYVIGATPQLGPDGHTLMVTPGTGTVFLTMDDYQTYLKLEPDITAMQDEYQSKYGEDVADQIARLNFEHDSDPRSIDATNSANAYARELQVREDAANVASQQFGQEGQNQTASEASLNNMLQSGLPTMFRMPSTNLPTYEDLFNKAEATVKKGLPDVTPEPYYNGTLNPPGSGNLGGEYASSGAGAFGSSSGIGPYPSVIGANVQGPLAPGQTRAAPVTTTATAATTKPSAPPVKQTGVTQNLPVTNPPGVPDVGQPKQTLTIPPNPFMAPPKISGSVLKPNPLITRMTSGILGTLGVRS